MDPEYARRYRELYERHWWWRAREQAILAALDRSRPPKGWSSILDVGCGDGLFFDRLSELGEVEGVEMDASLVSEASNHRDRIHIGPFDDTFQPGKRYSLVLMLDVLEHIADPVAPLRHAASLLASDGTLLVTVPAFNLLWTNHDDLNNHFTRYTRASFGGLARQAELRVDASKYFFHWLFPVKLAVRLAEAVLAVPPTPPRVPPRWINGCLYILSRIEHVSWGALPVPFGSSLMVVGRRLPD